MSDPSTKPSPPKLGRQCAAIAAGLFAFYLFVFPIPVIAADAAGFNLRQETDFGKAITNPLAWVAKRVPPYKAYLEGSRRVFGYLYAA